MPTPTPTTTEGTPAASNAILATSASILVEYVFMVFTGSFLAYS
jgi:hypothetical protein